MEEALAARYWCYLCSQMVNPIMEAEIKCPFCLGGFVEEMSSNTRDNQEPDSDFSSDRALSLWAPILLGMMGNPRRRRRLRRREFEEDDDDNDDGETRHGGEIDIDRELESFMRRRRRSSATILQLLQGIRAGMASESENSEGDRDRDGDRDRERDRERDRVILINPSNRTIIFQGSYDSSNGQGQNNAPIGSLDDYFIGPGLDLLLQHLAENDPNRYGTPPAQKEAIEALPTVTIKNTSQCSVCLDDFEIGTEAKEMPCKHRFHDVCILPWLELHSSCPVCRFQLPAEESKFDSAERLQNHSDQRGSYNNNISTTTSSNNINNNDDDDNNHSSNIEEGEGEGRNGNGRRFSFLWPFNSLFSSSSGSQSGGSNSSSNLSSSLGNAPGSSSQTDEN